MALPIERCGAVILAGGQSRRMGTCKALLELDGETMLTRLSRQLAPFSELLLSANDPALAEGLPVQLVPDRYPGAGPAAGLHAALSAAHREALFCIPCDLPRFDPALIPFLLERFDPARTALLCRDGTGRLHPTCGIYSKRALPILEQQLKCGEHRLRQIAAALDADVADTSGYLPDDSFLNMNTPELYQAARNGPCAL